MASIDDEIRQAIDASRGLIQAYVSWSSKIRIGNESNLVYSDLHEFVNFRVETADSCLALIERKSIADSLGLCRSLLENYLLLILMCRGRKYFRLENQDAKSHEEFMAYLAEQQAELERLRADGEAVALYVTKYPKGKRSLMYVFEGLTNPDEPDFFIPAHYFQFQEFSPEALRLRDENYFEYYPAGQSERKMRKDRRREADGLYHRYLSYDGLSACLVLNDILDDKSAARLDAHYTFLGRFLHPTHNAARGLHVNANYLGRETGIGISQEYAPEAILLAALYVAYLLAGIFDEIAGMVESAPTKYIECAGTDDLRDLTQAVPRRFPYFWFLFNRPPLWDKFNYAIHHVEDGQLSDYGGYENVPDLLVPFDFDIYGHLESAVSAWSANRAGAYKSPLPDRNAAPKFIFGLPVPRRE